MSITFSDYRVRQRDYLLSIARALLSRLNLKGVLRLILQGSVDMLQGQAGLIALRDKEGRFSFWASYGLPPAMVDAFQVLVEDVPETATAMDFSIPDLGEKLGEIAAETGLLLRQVVALPMVVEEDFLGLIFIFRSHSLSFSADERRVLASFADYAAIAVNNARLYETAVTERRRLDALLEASADGIMVLGADLTIERMNRALAALTGWRPDVALGRPHSAVIDWVRQPSPERTLSEAVRQGWPAKEPRALYMEGELRRRHGGVVSVGITYAPLLEKGGQLSNVIGVVRDITHFREADQLKETFISVVSHELKTPVSIIKGYAETLTRAEARRDPALVSEMLGVIVEEADRLARLVDDLLDASRLQVDGLPFEEVQDVDLRLIARRVVERYASRDKRHELILDFPSDFPLINGDPGRLEQVLDNLVSNAIKYSPEGGTVRIAGTASPAEVVLSVSDEGLGIPLDEQERIFERFHRVESPQTRAISGTGLGLYLTRAIVRAHGGRIWVESDLGQGTTFYVALPRQTGLALWRER